MFDIGATELLVIAIVAIIVVGPRELPRMLRNVGQWVAKAKGMAREFQDQFEQAAEEAGVDKIREDLTDMTDIGDISPDLNLDDALDPFKDTGEELNKTIELPDTPDTMPEKSAEPKAGDKPKTASTSKSKAAKKPAKKGSVKTAPANTETAEKPAAKSSANS